MLKIFFITFFIAELIIATALILNIYRLNKVVNDLNSIVLDVQDLIKIGFADLRLIFKGFNKKICEFKELMQKKREKYFVMIIKTSLIYSSLFLLRGKYSRQIMAYQFLKQVYEGIREA